MTGITKRFGAVRAIRNADLTVKVGQVHALVGENGAGKSTMIKILSGAETADTGSIAFEGRPVSDHLHIGTPWRLASPPSTRNRSCSAS